MCISAVMLASTAISTCSAIKQGQAARAAGTYQAAQAKADADAVEGAARVQAAKIREASKRQQAAVTAAAAGSGVDINSASVLDINREVATDYESDALATIYSGRNAAGSRRAEGGFAAAQGRARQGNALLGAASTAASGWYSAFPRKPAAPITRMDTGATARPPREETFEGWRY